MPTTDRSTPLGDDQTRCFGDGGSPLVGINSALKAFAEANTDLIGSREG